MKTNVQIFDNIKLAIVEARVFLFLLLSIACVGAASAQSLPSEWFRTLNHQAEVNGLTLAQSDAPNYTGPCGGRNPNDGEICASNERPYCWSNGACYCRSHDPVSGNKAC